MNKFNGIIFSIIISLLFACNNGNPYLVETENYTLKFNKASNYHTNFTNHVQPTPLNINAERISLKKILAILAKVDTSAIKFEDKFMGNEFYNFKIEQKNNTISINKFVIEDITEKLNLELETQQLKSFEIIIKDSLQFLKHLNKSYDNVYKIINTVDSISIINLELIKFTELLNKEYSNTIFCKNNYKKIDYKWRKSTLKKLKQNIQNDLGLILSDTKNDKFIYTFKEI